MGEHIFQETFLQESRVVTAHHQDLVVVVYNQGVEQKHWKGPNKGAVTTK